MMIKANTIARVRARKEYSTGYFGSILGHKGQKWPEQNSTKCYDIPYAEGRKATKTQDKKRCFTDKAALLIRRSLVRVQQGEPKRTPPNRVVFFLALLAHLRQRIADQQTVSYRLSVAKEVAKSMPRCRWQMKGYGFVCSGRCATQPLRWQGAHRVPQTVAMDKARSATLLKID